MKKLIFIGFLALYCFTSCKKETTPPSQPYIVGNWNQNTIVDTAFYSDGHETITTNPSTDVLTFTSDHYLTDSQGNGNVYTYSLTTNKIQWYYGNVYSIIKVSDTQIRLIYSYNTDSEIIREGLEVNCTKQ